jgi:hydroxypyruvate isomerase
VKFSANLSILFTDVPFLERFSRALKAGFRAVEFWWPSDVVAESLVEAARESGTQVVIFNLDMGDPARGDRGLLSNPQFQDRFWKNAIEALELAARLKCPRLHAPVGLRVPSLDRAEQLDFARKNLAWVADLARERGIEILVEALNVFDNGPCLITTTQEATALIDAVNRDNVRLQYDVYHAHLMEGNLVETLRRLRGRIGHIQIADSPGRGEPGTGEIDFCTVFTTIDEVGYSGHIGLEYRPTTGTTEWSFGWLPEDRCYDNVSPDKLRLFSQLN